MNDSIIRVRCCDMCGQSPCVNPSFCRVCRIEARKPRRRGVLSVEIEPARLERVRRMLADDVSLERAYNEFNKPLSTSQTTIEAILHCVRERGVAALKEPANIERLSRCDAAARTQIKARMRNWGF
jgi:hypothetical protein